MNLGDDWTLVKIYTCVHARMHATCCNLKYMLTGLKLLVGNNVCHLFIVDFVS